MIALLLVTSLLLVAVSTAAAAAVRVNSRSELRRWAERSLGGATERPAFITWHRRLLVAAGTIGATALVLGGAGLAHAWIRLGWPAGAVLAMIFLVVLTVLGHSIPRAAVVRWPDAATFLLVPLRVVARVLAPLLENRLAPEGSDASPAGAGDTSPGDQLAELLREGLLEGVGEDEEASIIADVARLGATTAADVMTDRANVFSLDESLPPESIARGIAESGYSRVPLYRGSPENVTGMVHAFDVLRLGDRILEARRPLLSVAAETSCSDLLRRMLREPAHLMLVTDASGRALGVVTLEDVLEEVVGDIDDEHDEPGTILTASRG